MRPLGRNDKRQNADSWRFQLVSNRCETLFPPLSTSLRMTVRLAELFEKLCNANKIDVRFFAAAVHSG